MTDDAKAERLASINEAIRRGGGIIAFSRKLGIAHQSVSYWRKQGHVPPDRALLVEQLFGVPRRSLVHPSVLRFLETPDAEGSSIL